MKSFVIIACAAGGLLSVLLVLAALSLPEWDMKVLGILAGVGLFHLCKAGMSWTEGKN